jgi:Zn-dependent protease
MAGRAVPRPAATQAPAPSAGKSAKESGKKAAVGLAALLAILAKFGKALSVALKVIFGGAKFAGLVPTALTMLASVWVYAQLWGWWFAGGLVALLLLHELGHAAIIKAKGLRTSPIVFLPFFGAAIAIKDQFRDASVEAETAWGGPAGGTLAAGACFLVYLFTRHEFWLQLAYLGFLLNLFNLLPVSPMDGGRIVTAISTWLWVPGLLLAGLLAVRIGHPILILIVLLGALRAYEDWRRRRAGTGAEYYALTPRYRALISVGYFGLCAFLGWMTWHTHALAQAALDAG